MIQTTSPDLLFDRCGEECPQTQGWPLIGSIPSLMRSSFGFFEQARKQYGDIYALHLGLSQIIVCNHPRHVQHILRDNAQNYVKDGPLWALARGLLGNGLVNSQGDFWLRQRRMMQPQFHKKRLAALTGLMSNAIEEALATWSASDKPIDLTAPFNQLTMRVIVRTMFGTALSTAQMDEVGRAMSGALDYMLRGIATSALPDWIPDPGRKAFQQSIKLFDDAVYQMIDAQRRGEGGESHLLAMLLDVVDAETGEGMTDQQLRDEVATIFLAGFETTATTLAWSTYFMAQHPEMRAKLETEVDTVLDGRTPTFEDLPQLTYTRMVLQESMRLSPSSWFTPRQAVEEDVIDGIRIPAGSEVATLTYMIHRHPDEWQEPDRFDPERFTEERSTGRHRFAWVPFGAGQRMCIGREFALMEGQLALAMLVQRFRPCGIPGYTAQRKLSATLKTSNGVCVKLAER